MRKKYIAIAISLVLIALIVTFGQIFTVQNVKVVFNNETDIATETSIIDLAGIDSNTNIFSLKESVIKSAISDYYSNAITVDIERTFPNTVIIHVSERIPMFLLSVDNDNHEGYIYTDKDFQRSDIYDETASDVKLIEVIDFTVKSTFDTAECIALRQVAATLIGLGMEDNSVIALIDSITIESENLIIKLRENNATWVVKRSAVASQTTQIYNQYVSLTPLERVGAYITC